MNRTNHQKTIIFCFGLLLASLVAPCSAKLMKYQRPRVEPFTKTYNYEEMIKLVALHQKFTHDYLKDCKQFMADQTKRGEIKITLRRLEKERKNFSHFVRRVRNEKHRSVPRKYIKRMKFYQKSLTEAIDDLHNILSMEMHSALKRRCGSFGFDLKLKLDSTKVLSYLMHDK